MNRAEKDGATPDEVQGRVMAWPRLQHPGDNQPDHPPAPFPQGVQREKPVPALDGEKKTGPTKSPARDRQEESASATCVQSNPGEPPGSSISNHDGDGRQAQRLRKDGREETDGADAPGNHPKAARPSCNSGGDGPQAETLPENSPGGGQISEAHSGGCALGKQEETSPMD
jgi:hypothetical protein